MNFSRGIARAGGRALAVKRANAALFGTLSVTPKIVPAFNAAAASSRRNFRNDPACLTHGM